MTPAEKLEALDNIIADYRLGVERYKELDQVLITVRQEVNVLTNLVQDQLQSVNRAMEQAIELAAMIREEREQDSGDWWKSGGSPDDE